MVHSCAGCETSGGSWGSTGRGASCCSGCRVGSLSRSLLGRNACCSSCWLGVHLSGGSLASSVLMAVVLEVPRTAVLILAPGHGWRLATWWLMKCRYALFVLPCRSMKKWVVREQQKTYVEADIGHMRRSHSGHPSSARALSETAKYVPGESLGPKPRGHTSWTTVDDSTLAMIMGCPTCWTCRTGVTEETWVTARRRRGTRVGCKCTATSPTCFGGDVVGDQRSRVPES